MKTEVWVAHRRRLSPAFANAGITRCELQRSPQCTGAMFLGFAHAKKRRNLAEHEEALVVLACTQCHQLIERMPEEKMGEIVVETIRRRRVQPDGFIVPDDNSHEHYVILDGHAAVVCDVRNKGQAITITGIDREFRRFRPGQRILFRQKDGSEARYRVGDIAEGNEPDSFFMECHFHPRTEPVLQEA